MKDIQGIEFDPFWIAEFRGLFWGEGNISLQKIHRKSRGDSVLYRIRARMCLRSDDEEVLLEFQRRLGGTIYREQGSHSHPTTTWDMTNQKSAEVIAELLTGAILPSKKARQVPIWKEALSIIQKRKVTGHGWGGKQYTEEQWQKLDELYLKLRELKLFDC